MDLSKDLFTTSFVKRRNLNSLMANLNYISSKKRQDFLEDYYNPKDKSWWKALADYSDFAKEKTKHKQKRTIQAREYIVRFTNDTYDTKAFSAKDISDSIYDKFGLVAAVALHHSRVEDENGNPVLKDGHTIMNEDNYHAHIVVCDRELNPKPLYAYRNIYLDESGKRVYKKELAKTIVPKGSYVPTSLFGRKIKDLRLKHFTEDMHDWACKFNNEHSNIYDVVHIKSEDRLFEPQVNVGRNKSPNIKAKTISHNNSVKMFNELKSVVSGVYYDNSDKYLGGYLDSHLFEAIDRHYTNTPQKTKNKLYGMAAYINHNGGIKNYKKLTFGGYTGWIAYNLQKIEEEIYKYLHPVQDDYEYEYGYGRTR